MRRVAWFAIPLGVFLAAGAAGVWIGRPAPRRPGENAVRPELLAAARSAWAAGSYAEVIRLLHQVPDSSPFAAQARFEEGRSLWKLNRWQEAEQAWHRALELDPLVPEATWHLLRFYFVEQRWREAEQLGLRQYAIEPDRHDRTMLLLELVRLDIERLSAGETALLLEPVVTLEPDNFHAVRVLGLCYVQLGRVAEGLPLVERATTLRPVDTEGWFTLVWCLYEAGAMDRLGPIWQYLPAGALEDPRFLRYRGMWAEAMGDPEQARRDYQATLTLDPLDRKAHYQLGRLLRNRGDAAGASAHEAEARRLDDAHEQLASCYTSATQQHDNPSAELCREFSRLCRVLGRAGQAERWKEEGRVRSEDPSALAAAQFRASAAPLELPAKHVRPGTAAPPLLRVPPPSDRSASRVPPLSSLIGTTSCRSIG